MSEIPYPNEHACRLVDPDKVDVVGSEEREHEGKEYRVIYGKPKDDGGAVEQAYRYPLSEGWTEAEARAHCKEHGGILFEPAGPSASSLGYGGGRERKFLAAVHSIETGEEENLATFYIMNTTVNRNGWGVSDKALEEALPTILRKPIGCGPDYKIDGHYFEEAMDVGVFVRSDKPDGYALGTAEITDSKAWEYLVSGEWGPISVVIQSYRETCSRCGVDLTPMEDPFSHDCIVDRMAYVLVESFVFERVDFIDLPAVPQAGFINVASSQTQVSLRLLARFYETQSLQASAVSWKETPRAPEDRAWDVDAAEARVRAWAGGPDKEGVDWAKYRTAFAWYDREDSENFGGYKLLHHDVIDGRLHVVWSGVKASMQVLLGARDGVDLPRGDRRAVYNHLVKEYGLFDKEPPEYHESQSKQDPAQGPGAHSGSNPDEKERKNQLDSDLQQRVTQLEQQLTDETKAREAADERVTELETKIHAEIVESVIEARSKAGLVTDADAEREMLSGQPEAILLQLEADAVKTAKMLATKTEPKAKYAGHSDELKTTIEDTRQRLFGRRNT